MVCTLGNFGTTFATGLVVGAVVTLTILWVMSRR